MLLTDPLEIAQQNDFQVWEAVQELMPDLEETPQWNNKAAVREALQELLTDLSETQSNTNLTHLGGSTRAANKSTKDSPTERCT